MTNGDIDTLGGVGLSHDPLLKEKEVACICGSDERVRWGHVVSHRRAPGRGGAVKAASAPCLEK